QRQTRHGWLDTSGQGSLVEILERAGPYTGPGGRTFAQAFPIMIGVLVQTANGDLFLRTSQSAFNIAIVRTAAGFQSKSAVSPKLSLSAETMRGLDQRHRQGGANRSQ